VLFRFDITSPEYNWTRYSVYSIESPFRPNPQLGHFFCGNICF
jgi:hypothetical protein